ncbi:MAG: AAA family ATPase, partial [Bacteriovoracales bacterium]|nr:AAA family ATPase [Bacteriovoracales bacterium]
MQAFQLSTHLANQGHRVLAIDLDSQANLSTTLGINIQRTLIPEWLIGDIETQEIILTSEGKGKLFESLSIIPSSRHLANMSKLLIL